MIAVHSYFIQTTHAQMSYIYNCISFNFEKTHLYSYVHMYLHTYLQHEYTFIFLVYMYKIQHITENKTIYHNYFIKQTYIHIINSSIVVDVGLETSRVRNLRKL